MPRKTIKFTDKRWIVRKTKTGWLIKTVKLRMLREGESEKEKNESAANVNLVKNAPRLYHCVEKLVEEMNQRKMRTSLDIKNKDIEYWKKKALELQQIRDDMDYWITNAEKLLDLVDYIWDNAVQDEIWKAKGVKYGGFYTKSM